MGGRLLIICERGFDCHYNVDILVSALARGVYCFEIGALVTLRPHMSTSSPTLLMAPHFLKIHLFKKNVTPNREAG